MNAHTAFTVLIERRALKKALALLTSIAMLFGMLAPRHAFATPGNGNAHGHAKKVARDLESALDVTQAHSAKWSREINGQRHVQVVIVSNSSDAEMTDLRSDIAKAGGSVHVRLPGLHTVTATLPAMQVAKIAARSDVESVVPNRVTQRTASALEAITGSLTTGVRTSSTKTSYSGVDGTGVGIAVLDSGVMKAHKAFNNASGATRVQRNVWMLSTTLANWTTGANGTTSLQPGSTALSSYESAVANDTYNFQDGYGHGTLVASIAAGRPVNTPSPPT